MQDTLEVRKEDIEATLETSISDELFEKGLTYAKRKQQILYQREQRPAILKKWYLEALVVERVKDLALSRFTMDLCRIRRDMEKEHSVEDQSALSSTHIVTDSAL